jgi:hypothetical protein
MAAKMNQNKKKRIFAAGLDKLGFIEANGHKSTKQASVWLAEPVLEHSMRARTIKPKFLAQVTDPQALVIAS